MAKPLPGLDVPVVDGSGRMTLAWFEYFQSHQKLQQLPDVTDTAPTNGQVLTYDATLKKWKPV